MASPTVQLNVEAGVAVVTIARPEVRNAIDLATAEAIEEALDRADADEEVSAIVLTGAGGVFSAGMDLKAFAASGERPATSKRGAFGIAELPPLKPAVAAVEGPCLGGGFEIALACDLIVAGQSTSFGLPEVSRGLTAAAGGLVRLPRRVPRNLAMQIALAGERLGADRAHDLGLVARTAPDGEVLAAALELAGRIAAGAPLAVRASKQIVRSTEALDEEGAFAAQKPLVDAVRGSEDAREGARSFVEKRSPRWSGR